MIRLEPVLHISTKSLLMIPYQAKDIFSSHNRHSLHSGSTDGFFKIKTLSGIYNLAAWNLETQLWCHSDWSQSRANLLL